MQTKCALILLSLVLLLSWSALAAPPNTVTLDGRPYEYGGVELRGTNTEPTDFGNTSITNLYVTWDATYLYVMLQGQRGDNKLTVLMDVDPGNNTGATTTTNWLNTGADHIDYNGPGWVSALGLDFGLDYVVISGPSGGNVNRVLYNGALTPDSTNVVNVLDEFNSIDIAGDAVDIVTQYDDTGCPLQGFEARISWAELFNTNRFGTVGPGNVPTNATLRLLGLVQNDEQHNPYSSSNAIPVSARSSYADGELTTTNYVTVVVDGDGDGSPDLASGDSNAPFITSVTGGEGGSVVQVAFNEATTAGTASNTANYAVGGAVPSSATVLTPTQVQLDLASPLPPEGTLVLVESSGIQDATGNSKDSAVCLITGPTSIDIPVTVTFVLNTNSGFAASHGATEFFVNGGALPLQYGFPPETNTPMVGASGDFVTNDVTFPAGTPSQFGYKYSGIINGITDTNNNYEAVRLDDYENQTRWLNLNNFGTAMVVTDYLGAAAAPLRQGGEGSKALYDDTRRGDAGVRERTTVLFQVDLSARNLDGYNRVLIQGTDPLRGFNAAWNSSTSSVGDFADSPALGWAEGGLTMFDDATHGDLVAGDKIYSLEWVWSTDGTDTTAEPGFPNSLVGGNTGTSPYGGFGWNDRRSPRNFSYKVYVANTNTDAWIESPTSNIDQYIHDADGTSITNPVYVWENNQLPKLTASNPATIVEIFRSGVDIKIVYTNISIATDNSLETFDDLLAGSKNYDLEGVGVDNTYTATVVGATNEDFQAYGIRSPGFPQTITWWTPNPAPFGGSVDVFFTQNDRPLSGSETVGFASNINGWDGSQNPMTFLSNGIWTVTIDVPTNSSNGVYWKATNQPLSPTTWDGRNPDDKDFAITHDAQGVSWSPNQPTAGGTLDVTYDATGRSLEGAPLVNIHYGFDSWDFTGWTAGTAAPGDAMTQDVSNSNEWTFTINVPTTATATVNLEFNDGSTWDGNDGKNHNVFIAQP